MYAFPKSFFKLTLLFAEKIKILHTISYEQALFNYTPVYTRVIGYSDNEPPRANHPIWQKILSDFPNNLEHQTAYIYEQYIKLEQSKKNQLNNSSEQVQFGCFSYFYNSEKNSFVLHFTNNDPQGNLGRNRVEQRMSELKQLTLAIKNERKIDSKIEMKSWLLNIEAMQRLLPPGFIQSSCFVTSNKAQDNSFWGQFVDRSGHLQTKLADELLANTSSRRDTIEEYFPIKNKKASVNQSIFFDFYL